METVLTQRHRALNWWEPRANRFAPVLAPLRCARPVEGLKRFDRKVALMKVRWLESGHERFSTLSADFRLGGTVGGGECDPQTQGTGDRGAGGICRHAVGVSAVSKAHAHSRL